MPFATGSRIEWAYVAESTYGTTPATPTMLRLRTTEGAALDPTKGSLVSAERRSDRQIVDFRHGHTRVGGTLPFELSYGAFDTWLAAVLFGSWSTNVLKAGTTLQSFSMQEAFPDITQFSRFTGVVPNTLDLRIAVEAMVTGSFGVVGRAATPSQTDLDSTVTDVATHPPFDTFTGLLTEGGVTLAEVTALTLRLDNGVEPMFALFDTFSKQVSYDRSNLTGTLSAYFSDAALYNKFINETESAIAVTLDGPAGGDLLITIPRIKYTGRTLNRGMRGLIQDMPFQALRGVSDATNIMFTRTPA